MKRSKTARTHARGWMRIAARGARLFGRLSQLRVWALTLALMPSSSSATCALFGGEGEKDRDDAVISPVEAPCPSETTVQVKAVLHTSVNEQDYRNFVENISRFFKDHDVPLTLAIASLTRAEALPSRTDTALSNDVDFTMLVGPGWGGYMGPPYFNVGANTDAPFGWSQTGIVAEAHEVLHHFGVPDYYTVTSDALDADPAVRKDLMLDVYRNANPTLHPNTRRIVCLNLNATRAQGRSGIYYPVPESAFSSETRTRFASQVAVSVDIPGAEQPCTVYQMTFDWTKWVAGYAASAATTSSMSAGQAVSFTIADIHQWYSGFKIECGGARPYFAPSPALEDCFFAARSPATVSSCRLTCAAPGQWCSGN